MLDHNPARPTTVDPEALIDPRWRRRRVAVAMSGGVDSSVAAVICHLAGCDVVGVTMKLWEYDSVGGDHIRDGRCCTVEAFDRCRQVAAQFGFPHYLFDFTEDFERTVICDFLTEYRSGRTPNPCMLCNRAIKWGVLWEKATQLGCEALVTGHYAQCHVGADGDLELRRGADRTRDQSYFLWRVPPDRLARTIFPLGGLAKSDVRALAESWSLPTAETPESRDLCFVEDGDLHRFFDERNTAADRKPLTGAIVDQNGEHLGHHAGFDRYTIGQRRGLGVALGRPQYVTAIDPETATITVGDESELWARTLETESGHWLATIPESPFHADVQIRYRHDAAPAVVVDSNREHARITFLSPQRAITPGQSAVIYNGDRVLGGGIIATVSRES